MTAPAQPPAIPETQLSSPHWFRLNRAERKGAITAACGVWGVLIVAAILTPDERGLGTHQQLGLPPCMAESLLGMPCPFCGMTTSYSHMADGEIAEAIAVQPAGAFGFVATALLAVGFTLAAATGRAPSIWKRHRHSPWLYVAATVVIGVAWIYKILAYRGVI